MTAVSEAEKNADKARSARPKSSVHGLAGSSIGNYPSR